MNFDDDDDNLAMRDQILEKHGPPSGASWRWRALPDLGVEQPLGGACVLSDGRFAVFAIKQGESPWTRASKVLTVDEQWVPLPPMRMARSCCVCAAISGCVIVIGGTPGGQRVEVYEEALKRWWILPCNLPLDDECCGMSMALM